MSELATIIAQQNRMWDAVVAMFKMGAALLWGLLTPRQSTQSEFFVKYHLIDVAGYLKKYASQDNKLLPFFEMFKTFQIYNRTREGDIIKQTVKFITPKP
jgi:hypothetical protein